MKDPRAVFISVVLEANDDRYLATVPGFQE
jgi:hypothetical protein